MKKGLQIQTQLKAGGKCNDKCSTFCDGKVRKSGIGWDPMSYKDKCWCMCTNGASRIWSKKKL